MEDWFKINFNEETISIEVRPPGGNEWSAKVNWSEIKRICYRTTGFLYSDEIYIFVKDREESYLVPTEADGGMSLWFEIIERKLFDAELAVTVATAAAGVVHCCPPIDD